MAPSDWEAGVRFRILGSLEVWTGAEWVGIGAAKSRSLLAALLIRREVVSVDQLIGELWGDDPPKSAATQVHGYVSRLRRLLGDGVLMTESPGYRLGLDEGDVDVDVFEELLADGSAEALQSALALWRGAPLSDVVSTGLVAAESDRLAERQLVAWEAWIDAELALGHHAALIGELRHQVDRHPLREGAWHRLMLALYRAGRQAEALQAYQRVRTILLDELGVEPSASLRELHRQLLTGELPAPGPAWVPRQLPAAPPFVGRAAELAELDLAGGVVAITGPAGVGKTALAVYWANLASGRFPDGQLYVNLRGYDQSPSVAPTAVLARFLSALGVARQVIPRGIEDRAALYRRLLAGKRLLVLLDNASGPDQVRPLLPPASCLALVTSRDELRDLDAARLRLGVLSHDDAIAVLVSVLGAVEEAELDELAVLCGHLPLALRIAAANLVARPQQTVAGHVADLREGNRLNELSVLGDRQTAVRAAFDLSYTTLPAPAQRLFRLLGLVPGPDFTADLATALLGAPAAGPLDQLVAAHVVEPGAPGRFVLHDLVRLYAEECADDDPAALRRVFDYYLANASAEPRWLDAEYANLIAIIRHPALRTVSWRLVYALRKYFWVRRLGDDWVAAAHIGLAAVDDETGQAQMRLSLGHAYWCVGEYQQAIEHYTLARAYAQRVGWQLGESSALNGLAVSAGQLGRLEQSIGYLTEALRIDRSQGARDNEARRLNNLGFALQNLGRLEEAAEYYRQSLAVRTEIGDRVGQWTVLAHLGQLHWLLGDFDKSLELGVEALRIGENIGAKQAQAVVHRNIALVHRDAGRYDLARSHAERALPFARDSGDHEIHVGVLTVLGTTLAALGEHAEADRCQSQVLDITSTSGYAIGRVEALIGLADLRIREHRFDEAIAFAGDAVSLARHHKLRVQEGQALTELAAALGKSGRVHEAIERAAEALAVHRATGHRPGEERAVHVLDRLRG
jgi:DNA-binding SARP family transcriptional activator/Flp pilus assembly protein TadD